MDSKIVCLYLSISSFFFFFFTTKQLKGNSKYTKTKKPTIHCSSKE